MQTPCTYDIFKLIFFWNTGQNLSSDLKEKKISLTIYPLKTVIIKTTCDSSVNPYNIVTNFGAIVKPLPKCQYLHTYLPVNIHHSKVSDILMQG